MDFKDEIKQIADKMLKCRKIKFKRKKLQKCALYTSHLLRH